MNIPAEAWQGREGCNEWLNLAFPSAIQELHEAFIAAGSQAIETNSFGANRVTLSEYGLQDRAAEINHAAAANALSVARGKNILVAGSIGPGTKLPTLGHIEPEVLMSAVEEQAEALLSAGVDMLILETCQDLLQVKLGVAACFSAMRRVTEVPLLVSLTLESSGTMLVGSDIAAASAMLEPFPIASLGLNCATGPDEMESHIRFLHENWGRPVSCMPNQGLPEIQNGKTVYPLSPSLFAKKMLGFAKKYSLAYAGGCCGTTPAHIKAMRDAFAGEGLL
jgi:5-methyltetrahydrofolate--homocysteine methyltransferase